MPKTTPRSTAVTPKIQAVVWDFGGVFSASPFSALERFAAAEGIDSLTYQTTVFGPFEQDTPDHPWHRLERGEHSLDDALAEIRINLAEVGIEADPFGWLAAARDQSYEPAPLIARSAELREQGVRQAILTNNIAAFSGRWQKLVDIEKFDLVIDSHEVGCRKPAPEIFQLTLEQLGLEASSTVFLDDLAANVAGAEAVGMHGIVVGPDPQQTLTDLNWFFVD